MLKDINGKTRAHEEYIKKIEKLLVNEDGNDQLSVFIDLIVRRFNRWDFSRPLYHQIYDGMMTCLRKCIIDVKEEGYDFKSILPDLTAFEGMSLVPPPKK